MSRYFVWLYGSLGPIPQLWSDDVLSTGDGKKKVETFFGPHKLTADEELMTFDELIAKFKDRVNDSQIR